MSILQKTCYYYLNKDTKDTMENTNKQSDNIFAQIILEQSHLRYINDLLEEMYDTSSRANGSYDTTGAFTEYEDAALNFLYNEKEETQDRLRELKIEYKNIMKEESKTCSGKIEIEYDDISNETLFELYRYLNRWVYTGDGKVSYHTVENNTKYSKDFCYEADTHK